MAGQSLHFRIGQNDEQWFFVPFPISQVIIDNPGSYWVHFPEAWGGYAFVWPQRFGASVPAPIATPGNLHVSTKDTPPGQTPAGASTAIATLTVYEEVSPLPGEAGGTAAPSFNPGQALQTLDTVAGDISPVGVSAGAGIVGLAADAGHIHQGTPITHNGSLSGPWPQTLNFSTTYPTARLAVAVSATAQKTTGIGFFEVDVSVDGGNQGAAGTYTNSFGVHWTGATVFCGDIVVAAGAHTLVVSLNQGPGSSTSDANDRAYIQILEFPKAN